MANLKVYYDGECPICRLEIAFYRKRDKAAAIDWVDVHALTDEGLPKGKSRADLLGRFHVLGADKTWHVGVDAFAVIWRALPGFRHFAWIFSTPGLRQVAELGYRGFLAWQKRARRSRRSHAAA